MSISGFRFVIFIDLYTYPNDKSHDKYQGYRKWMFECFHHFKKAPSAPGKTPHY
jgi:hypothetical protein